MAPSRERDRRACWKRTFRRTVVLMAVWLLVGPVMSILLVEQMNRFSLAGVPFGAWMAQQGSIYMFVLLIFAYAWLSVRSDGDFRVEDGAESTAMAADH